MLVYPDDDFCDKSGNNNNINKSDTESPNTGDQSAFQSIRSTLSKGQRSWVDPLEPKIQETFYHKNIGTLRPNYGDLLKDVNDIQNEMNNLFDGLNNNNNSDNNIDTNSDELLKTEEQNYQNKSNKKFGTYDGVLMRCLLNIFGIILFIRLGFVVSQGGLICTILIITACTTVTFITTLSMAALCCNGKIEGGGLYYIISRSLGENIGGTIGLLFSIGNSIATSMYLIGFSEIIIDTLNFGDLSDSIQIRLWSNVALLMETIVALTGGVALVTKLSKGLLMMILTVILFIFIGSIYKVNNDAGIVGWKGFNNGNLNNNLWSEFTTVDGVQYNFFRLLALFFPAHTGIMAGANISSELKNPSKNIPKGTLIAISFTSSIYLLLSFILGVVIERSTLSTNSLVLQSISVFKPIFIVGVVFATLAAAISSLTSASAILLAIINDDIIPILSKLLCINEDTIHKNNKTVIFSFIIAFLCNLIGSLNIIAPLITDFYLISYLMINFLCFLSSMSKSPGWRPTFKYYNKYVALFGTLLCFSFIILNNWVYAILSFLLSYMLYVSIKLTNNNDLSWGKVQESREYYEAYMSVLKLDKNTLKVNSLHARPGFNWRPGFLVLCGDPLERPYLINFADTLSKSYSPIFYGLIKTDVKQKYRENILKFHQSNYNHYLPRYLLNNKKKGFFESIFAKSMREGTQILLQTCGLGNLRPNTLLIGFRHNWRRDINKSREYIEVIRDCLEMGYGILILRNFQYVDWRAKSYLKIQYSQNPFKRFYYRRSRHNNDNELINHNVLDNYNIELSAKKPNLSTILSRDVSIDLSTVQSGKTKSIVMNSKMNVEDDSTIINDDDKKYFDVYWLIDDGGLTVLLPYILSLHRFWRGCLLRLNIITSNVVDDEYLNICSLMNKFRLKYEKPNIIEINKSDEYPKPITIAKFKKLIDNNINMDKNLFRKSVVTKWLKITEIIHEYSINSGIIFITLPLPTKLYKPNVNIGKPNKTTSIMNTKIYFAILEMLTENMPPTIVLRGNGQNALTFYTE